LLDLLPPPVFTRISSLVVYFWISEENTPLRVHAGTAGAANQIVKIANFDTFLALINACHKQVPNWEIDTLRQRRGADYKSGQAFTHRVLNREPNSMRSISVMREDPD